DPADQFLEAAPLRGGSGTQAEIAVDDVNIGLTPSEFTSALPERVLKAQALLVAHDLMRRRLADVHDRFARQMRRHDQFRLHDGPPPRPRRRRRRSDAAEAAAASPRDLSGLSP